MKQEPRTRDARLRGWQIHILLDDCVSSGLVANASIMVVNHAERFCLSQLHHCAAASRGMGSHCCCFIPPWTDDARERLKAMAVRAASRSPADSTSGPGDFSALVQWDCRAAHRALVRDRDIMEAAHAAARRSSPMAG